MNFRFTARLAFFFRNSWRIYISRNEKRCIGLKSNLLVSGVFVIVSVEWMVIVKRDCLIVRIINIGEKVKYAELLDYSLNSIPTL